MPASILSLLAVVTAGLPSPVHGADDESALQSALRHHPPTETNAAALDVERLAAPLGIDLVPMGVEDRPRPSAEQTAAFERIREATTGWIKRELERPSGLIGAPPKLVAGFVASRASQLKDLRAGILRGEPPVWAESLDPDDPRPRPRPAGRIYLGQLFIADALIEGRAGRSASAFEDLEAMWKLGEALPSSPSSTSRVLFVAMVRLECGAVRRLDHAPDVWKDRLRAFAPVESILEIMRLEVTLSPLFIRTEDFHIHGPFSSLRGSIVRAYWASCIREGIPSELARLDDIAAAAPFCDAPFDAKLPSEDFSWWNRIGRDFYEGTSWTVRGASRAALDAEMTLKILDLRAARDENHGRWPTSLAGIERSRTCPKDTWIYEVDTVGRMRLSLSRKPDWQMPIGTVLPTTYEEGPSSKRPAIPAIAR